MSKPLKTYFSDLECQNAENDHFGPQKLHGLLANLQTATLYLFHAYHPSPNLHICDSQLVTIACCGAKSSPQYKTVAEQNRERARFGNETFIDCIK